MRPRWLIFFSFLATGVPAFPQSPATARDSIQTALKDVLTQWCEGNPLAYTNILDDSATFYRSGSSKMLAGKKIVGQYFSWKSSTRAPARFCDITDPEFKQFGDAAVFTYFNIHDKVVHKATEVYARRNGSWKIVHAHWSTYGASLRPEWLDPEKAIGVFLVLIAGGLSGRFIARKSRPDGPVASIILVIMLFLVGAWNEQADPQIAGDPAKAMENRAAAWCNGNIAPYGDVYAEDASYFDASTPGRIHGKDSIIQIMASTLVPSTDPSFCTISDLKFQDLGTLGVMTYRFVHPARTFRVSEVYAQRENGWKIVNGHMSMLEGAEPSHVVGLPMGSSVTYFFAFVIGIAVGVISRREKGEKKV